MTNQAGPSASNCSDDELADDRRHMEARLHRSYLNLVEAMATLQAEWDAGPQAAFLRAAVDGWQLGAHWRDARSDVYDAAFWEALEPLEASKAGTRAAGEISNAAERLLAMRAQVLSLASVLAGGDKTAIKAQVSEVLRTFDAKFADQILHHEAFDTILEQIKHEQSVLAYMAYVGLLMTSVPPNFYAFVAGKGAPCLMLEGVVLAVTALVSGDNTTAWRGWEIEERFDQLEVDDTPASDALEIDAAVDAFIRMLDDFRRAAGDLHELCDKIGVAQQARNGPAATSIRDKMAAIVADTSCRDCGSIEHTTVLSRMGTVSYE